MYSSRTISLGARSLHWCHNGISCSTTDADGSGVGLVGTALILVGSGIGAGASLVTSDLGAVSSGKPISQSFFGILVVMRNTNWGQAAFSNDGECQYIAMLLAQILREILDIKKIRSDGASRVEARGRGCHDTSTTLEARRCACNWLEWAMWWLDGSVCNASI